MAPTPVSGADTEGNNRAPAANHPAQTSAPLAPGPAQGVRNFGNQRRMISELERINALNLEPSLPKVDDGNRSVLRHNQDRDKVKNEFQQFLSVMKKNDEAKAGGSVPSTASSSRKPDQGPSQAQKNSAGALAASQPNLNAQPIFLVDSSGPSIKNMQSILESMLRQALLTSPALDPAWPEAKGLDPDWPEAKGPSYHEVLGRPTGNLPGGNKFEPPGGFDNRQSGGQMQGNNPRGPQGGPGGNDQMQMRPQMPQGMQQQPQGGYVMAPGGQPGQPGQMQFMMPGMPQGGGQQGGMPMQGMQGQPMMFGQPQMFAQGPNNQGGGVPQGMMMMAPQQGGPQGAGYGQMMPPGADGQQQQMMFMPVMMAQDASGNYMPAQGMQGYPQQPGGGGPGNQQQGAYMMQQPVYNQQQANSG